MSLERILRAEAELRAANKEHSETEQKSPSQAPRDLCVAGAAQQTRPVDSREALIQQLEARESNLISQLSRLREAKLHVTMATLDACELHFMLETMFPIGTKGSQK